MSLCFGSAFVAKFTVENQTDEPIAVTPVGTVGQQGTREALPVYMWPLPPIWSSHRGGFEILPGESIDIIYDMDDINFSEIVVHSRNGEIGQVVVNPDPTRDQYHAPAQKHFVIDDLDSLAPVPRYVSDAARKAQLPTSAPWIIFSVLLAPWVLFIVLSRLNRWSPEPRAPQETAAIKT